MSSLALVLLLLVLGTLILTGLNQQLTTFSALVGGEKSSLQQQATVQSALEWGRVQSWSSETQVQCKKTPAWRVCLRQLSGARVLLIAGDSGLLLWRSGEIVDGNVRFSPHGWSDFCPLKESALCQLP
ncbi:protein YgdB [Enterobacter cloacae]|nr:protein YgdB [Enterobacter cloacae]